MAHWVAVVTQPEYRTFTGKTKKEVVDQISIALTNKYRYMASAIKRQLNQARDSVAIAYGKDGEEVAKTFVCNCGSVKKHLGEN